MNFRIVSHSLSASGAGFYLISILLKFQHYPGAESCKIPAFILIVAGALIRLTPAYKNRKKFNLKTTTLSIPKWVKTI